MENDINTKLANAWTATNRLLVIWKSDVSNKIKCNFSKKRSYPYYCRDALHACRLSVSRKKLDGNSTVILRVILKKSWKQHPSKRQLYGHQPPISKTIQIWRTRHAGHCLRSKGEPTSDVLLWTHSRGRAGIGRPAITYLKQLCTDRLLLSRLAGSDGR